MWGGTWDLCAFVTHRGTLTDPAGSQLYDFAVSFPARTAEEPSATGVFFCVRASSRVSAPVSNVASDTGRRVTPVFDGVDEMIAAVAVDHGASR